MYNAVLNNIPEEICGIPGPGVIGYFIPGQQRMSFTISYHHGITGIQVEGHRILKIFTVQLVFLI